MHVETWTRFVVEEGEEKARIIIITCFLKNKNNCSLILVCDKKQNDTKKYIHTHARNSKQFLYIYFFLTKYNIITN